MKYGIFIAAGMFGLLANHAIANSMLSLNLGKDWRWVGSISIGRAKENAGHTQTFNLTPDIVKTFSASRQTHTLTSGEIFAGLQRELPKAMQAQIGFAFAATENANLAGSIWDDADPEFNNANYTYQIHHTALALKAKLLKDVGCWITPWLSASLGIGFNNAHGFTNSSTIFPAIVMPDFASHTQTSFTYTLGAGLQKKVNLHWQVGVGYEFADWGRSQLNRAPGQTLNTGLQLKHLYTNSFLFNVTYLA